MDCTAPKVMKSYVSVGQADTPICSLMTSAARWQFLDS